MSVPKPRKGQAPASEATLSKRRADAEKVLSTLSAEVRQLVEQGRKRGYVTYGFDSNVITAERWVLFCQPRCRTG